MTPTIFLKGGKIALSFMTKNSNALLATAGLMSLTGLTISISKSVVKVKEVIKQRDSDLEIAKDEATEKQIKRAAAKKVAFICAIPALLFIICAGSILGNAYINNKKIAALAAAYALSEQKVEDLEDAAKELVGNKKSQLIEANAGEKDINRRAPKNEEAVINTGRGNDLFWEPKTGHWIRANRDYIKLAFSELDGISHNISTDEDELQLNSLLDRLKLPSDTALGAVFGWLPGDDVFCNLNNTGKHFWEDGSDEYYTIIDYTVKYLGPEGKRV